MENWLSAVGLQYMTYSPVRGLGNPMSVAVTVKLYLGVCSKSRAVNVVITPDITRKFQGSLITAEAREQARLTVKLEYS